jgi:hypothetical protein
MQRGLNHTWKNIKLKHREHRHWPIAAAKADNNPKDAWTAPWSFPSAQRDIMARTEGNSCEMNLIQQNIKQSTKKEHHMGMNHARHRKKTNTYVCNELIAWNRIYCNYCKPDARPRESNNDDSCFTDAGHENARSKHSIDTSSKWADIHQRLIT